MQNDAKEEVDDMQDEHQNYALFIDRLQSKLAAMEKVACDAGADAAEVKRAKNL